jgi:phage gp46-like protein
MPLDPDGGRDIALDRNPATGLFDLAWDETGNPAFTDDESHTVLSLLLEKQRGYWADKTGRRGSLLHTVKHDRAATASQLTGYTTDALDSAVEDGRINEVQAQAERVASGRFALAILYRPRRGPPRTLRLPYGG